MAKAASVSGHRMANASYFNKIDPYSALFSGSDGVRRFGGLRSRWRGGAGRFSSAGGLAEGVTHLFIVGEPADYASLIRPNCFLQNSNVARPAEPLGKVPLHLANLAALEADQASGAT
jgi:hypothetical protein